MYAHFNNRKTCPICEDILDVFYEKIGISCSVILYSCRHCFRVFDDNEFEKLTKEMKNNPVKNRIRKYLSNEDDWEEYLQ